MASTDGAAAQPVKKSRWGGFNKSGFKNFLSAAKVAGAQAMNNGKEAMAIAKTEFERQIKDVKVHGEQSVVGVKNKKETAQNSKIGAAALKKSRRVSSNAKTVASSAKSVTLTVAQKTKARFGQLVEVEYTMPMDREAEAGFDLVYHYSNQFSAVRRNAVKNIKKAHVAADTVDNQAEVTKMLNQQLTSLQAEMSALPNVMTILATSVGTIHKLRDGLHAMESALGSLDRLCDEVDAHRAKKSTEAKAREYQRHANTSLYIQKQGFAANLLKEKRAQESLENKTLHQRLKEQMLSFAEDVKEELQIGKTGEETSTSDSDTAADPTEQELARAREAVANLKAYSTPLQKPAAKVETGQASIDSGAAADAEPKTPTKLEDSSANFDDTARSPITLTNFDGQDNEVEDSTQQDSSFSSDTAAEPTAAGSEEPVSDQKGDTEKKKNKKNKKNKKKNKGGDE